MKEIPLSQGKVALVDDADFENLSQHKWSAEKGRKTWYASRKITVGPYLQQDVSMHRQILGLSIGDGMEGDHRDGNGLNNQRYNLRVCSPGQNRYNQSVRTHAKHSRFKGVSLKRDTPRAKPWEAYISAEGKLRKLGHFYTEEAAALAYNEAAKVLHGEFARLNVL